MSTKKVKSPPKDKKPAKTIFNFFPFQWQYADEPVDDDEKQLQTVIRIYGWNERNESVSVRIDDFPIPIWIELPKTVEWTELRLKLLHDHLLSSNRNPYLNPISVTKKMLHKLYYADVEKTPEGYKKKQHLFLQITFRSVEAISRFNYMCKKPIRIPKLGEINIKCHVSEGSITPVLKLIAYKRLPSSSWIRCKGDIVPGEDKETTRAHEYLVSFQDMKKHPNGDTLPIVHPKVCSFDIEVNSCDGTFPKKDRPEDKVFQIGCTLTWMEEVTGEDGQKQKVRRYKKDVFCLGDTKQLEDDCEIHISKSEVNLYTAFAEYIRKQDPDVIIGYNIFGFDIKYMVDRSKDLLNCYSNINQIGCIPGKPAKEMEIKWESSAFGKQDLMYLDADGRLFIDLLPYVQRNYKLHNYRLETVCDEFLKTNKDPLKAKDLFRIYKSKNPDDLGLVAKYCSQDTYVVLLLFEKLLIWFDLVEAATTNCVPIVYMYTKGQQIKMYNSLLQYCIQNDIVVESNAFTVDENEQYEGAIVTEPKAGLYKMILPFDFASLYPSIIMAHNIDYTKLVNDKNGKCKDIPDDDCYVFEWSRHLACGCPKMNATTKLKNKDGSLKKICGDYYYRFLKAEKTVDGQKVNVSGKGIIPQLLEELLAARKATRKVIEKNEDKIKELKKLGLNYNAKELEEMNQVLDKRQLAYKVSANSMYGAMGVKKGYLPFLPGAMCVTFKGRESILRASDFLERECGGNVIYNDTDSAYTYFSCLRDKSSEEIWSFAHDVVKRVAKLFPPPMKLEFEDKVYCKFLILTKKRYVGQTIDEEGVLGKKLTKRGIVLQRRDNCRLLRDIYERAVMYILKHIDHLTLLNRESTSKEILANPYVQGLINLIISGLSCSEKEDGTLVWDQLSNGSCLASLFGMDPGYTFKDFIITKGLTKETYKSKTPPVHVSVAMKMRERGIVVPPNSRIEYLLLDRGTPYNKNEKQNGKAEDIGYYVDNKSDLRIDYLFYLKSQMVKPLDELLRVCLFQTDIIKNHFNMRIAYNHTVNRMKTIFTPMLVWNEKPTWENTSLYEFIYEGSGMPFGWKDFFDQPDIQSQLKEISKKLEDLQTPISPSLEHILRPFTTVPLNNVKCVLLGSGPFPSDSTGLAFHTNGEAKPECLDLLREAKRTGFKTKPIGDLTAWIQQGVFLYNVTLTRSQDNLHTELWKPFSCKVLDFIGKRNIPAIIFSSLAGARPSSEASLPCDLSRETNSLQRGLSEYSEFFKFNVKVKKVENSDCFNKVNNMMSPGILWSTC